MHEVHDEDDEDDIQEVEARTIPKGNNNNNGKRKETHAVEIEDDGDEVQEVDPPPKMTRSRGGSRKPSSTVNGKPTSSAATAKGKAKAKPKLGSTKPATKPAHEHMDVDLNDVVEHDTDMGVNGTAAAINAATKNNAGRAPKSGGQQDEDGQVARLEEELSQVRFIGNYRALLIVLIEYSKLMPNLCVL